MVNSFGGLFNNPIAATTVYAPGGTTVRGAVHPGLDVVADHLMLYGTD